MLGQPRFVFDNLFLEATPVASSTADGEFHVSNLDDFRPYTWWKPAAMPATVTIDLGAARAADCAVVFGHDLGSSGCTYEVRGSTDDFATSDVLIASKTPANDDPFIVTWASVSFRYWRRRFVNGSAPSIAIAPVGVALEMPSRMARGFDPTSRQIEGQANISRRGHPLGNIIEFESWEQTALFRAIEWAWIRTHWIPAWEAHLAGNPFVFAWDADEHADEIYLVNHAGRYATPTFDSVYADLSVELSGVAR